MALPLGEFSVQIEANHSRLVGLQNDQGLGQRLIGGGRALQFLQISFGDFDHEQARVRGDRRLRLHQFVVEHQL